MRRCVGTGVVLQCRNAAEFLVHPRWLPTGEKELGGPVIELWDIAKEYELEGGERVSALKQISLHGGADSAFPGVRKGEFVMLRGASGGGKTTTLNIIGCIDAPTQGRLRLFDKEIDFSAATDAELAALRLSKIGFVFQQYNLLSTLSAFENVELPMSMAGVLSAKQRAAKAQTLLRLVGLEDRMTHLPSELSGGEQQRVTIARALANDPELLLLDEATGDLDTRNTVDIMDLLLRINQEHGMTMLMVTHNPDLECYADRVLYISDGTLREQAVNLRQVPLLHDDYVVYLNEQGK